MEINEERLKEILTEQRKEFQNYLGTVAESFESQVKLLAESVSGIQKQLIAIREMVAKNTEDIEIMKADIQVIKQTLRRKVDIEDLEALENRVLFLEKRTAAS